MQQAAASGLAQDSAHEGMDEERALMVRVAEGDAQALARLYERHARKLTNYFLRRLGRVERAQELTHDVFLALLGLGARYRPRAPFAALLYGIARRLLSKEYRRMKRSGIALDSAPTPEAPREWSEEGFALRQALSRLPERLREPLMLSVYEQLSYEEIAEVLARPIGTVRSRISRAKVALAAELSEGGDR